LVVTVSEVEECWNHIYDQGRGNAYIDSFRRHCARTVLERQRPDIA
jgi:hypothetical protein